MGQYTPENSLREEKLGAKCYILDSYNKYKTQNSHPIMGTKYKAFYRSNKEVLVDFSTEQISSDGAFLLLENNTTHFMSKFMQTITLL